MISKEQLEKVMRDAFNEVLDEHAPKQPEGSEERAVGLVVGGMIIAKTLEYVEGVASNDDAESELPSSDKDRLKELEGEFKLVLDDAFEDKSYLADKPQMLEEDALFEQVLARSWNWILSHAKELGELTK